MNTSPSELLLEKLNWRYATKQFDPERKISTPDWKTLEASLVLTPSSVGLQPWKFIVVEDPALRATLREVSYDQSQITDASHLLIIAAKVPLTENDIDEHIQNTAHLRGLTPEDLAPLRSMAIGGIIHAKSEQERKAWAFNQCYIALGNLTTSAALLEIDTCPMEGVSREDYDRILNLREQGYESAVVATLGYRSENDKYASLPKVRYPHSKVIEHRVSTGV